MNLADLKKENAAEESIEQEEVAETEETEEVTEKEEVTESIETEEVAETSEEETPLWMQEEEADDQTSADTVPLSALMKQKHKGKEKDARIEELEKQLAERQPVTQSQQPAERPKMPRADDFDTDEAHEAALEQFHYDVANHNASASSNTLAAQQQETARVQARDTAINGFIERADAVVVKHKINPETYKGALDSVQGIVENAFQGMGGNAFPEFLSRLEEGDETTLYQIGRNKGQQEKLASLLRDDPTGIKAFRHIARLTERNLGVKNKPSQASKPVTAVRGNVAVTAKEGAHLKKYKAAKSPQAAYDAKKAAKAAGIDTSKWS